MCAHLVYLSAIESIINKWKENIKLLNLEKNVRIKHENELQQQIEVLQSDSIDYLLKLHPSFYREVLKFHDWQSAMDYLEKNRSLINEFWQEEKS